MVTRRALLGSTLLGITAFGVAGWRNQAADAGTLSTDENFPIKHTADEWHKLLTPAQYAVLRESDTERPFSSPLLKEHRLGIFGCAGCKNDAFDSKTKFESGTGWPSFWAPRDNAVGETADKSFGMVRTAIHCNQCGGHLGHVFNDGPEPTGLRYCMNGAALIFTPAKPV